jgi:hypothetical protein
VVEQRGTESSLCLLDSGPGQRRRRRSQQRGCDPGAAAGVPPGEHGQATGRVDQVGPGHGPQPWTVNEWADRLGDPYRRIEIRELTLDLGEDLDLASKLDRRPAFLRRLFDAGREQAEGFLAGLPG